MTKEKHTPNVSAVVVTWNSRRDIEFCLNSLLAQSLALKEIIVIDNASHDETPELIRENFPMVNLEVREKNEGFAKGNNLGFEKSESGLSPYNVLLKKSYDFHKTSKRSIFIMIP